MVGCGHKREPCGHEMDSRQSDREYRPGRGRGPLTVRPSFGHHHALRRGRGASAARSGTPLRARPLRGSWFALSGSRPGGHCGRRRLGFHLRRGRLVEDRCGGVRPGGVRLRRPGRCRVRGLAALQGGPVPRNDPRWQDGRLPDPGRQRLAPPQRRAFVRGCAGGRWGQHGGHAAARPCSGSARLRARGQGRRRDWVGGGCGGDREGGAWRRGAGGRESHRTCHRGGREHRPPAHPEDGALLLGRPLHRGRPRDLCERCVSGGRAPST
mmetsp:Transcript_53632/g.160101  ORF Transcript_53632/g.160101 Transcript_53632/m.160101 type:complete len:268 (+) Transcript_53632:367-1170(+)